MTLRSAPRQVQVLAAANLRRVRQAIEASNQLRTKCLRLNRGSVLLCVGEAHSRLRNTIINKQNICIRMVCYLNLVQAVRHLLKIWYRYIMVDIDA
jgi:hypothetical protein